MSSVAMRHGRGCNGDTAQAVPSHIAPRVLKAAAAGPVASPQAAAFGDITVTATPVTHDTCDLSVIIPAYNEENRLPATLVRIAEYRAAERLDFELLVVDDGSRDGTRQVVRDFAASQAPLGPHWVRLVQYDDAAGHAVNRGKGFAVRQGVLQAVGRDVLFSDADLSTPIEEMARLLAPIRAGTCEVAIASRALPDSNLAVHQPWYRECMGRAFNLAVQMIAVPGIVDTQCGFKAFRGDVGRRVFKLALIDGFGFDTEILFLTRRLGFRVAEIPVTWRHMDDSRVSPVSAPLRMLTELVRVRINQMKGLYKEPAKTSDPPP